MFSQRRKENKNDKKKQGKKKQNKKSKERYDIRSRKYK